MEVDACFPEDMLFVSYAPMHQRESDEARRLAVATESEVRVYLLSERGLGEARSFGWVGRSGGQAVSFS